MKDTIVAFGSGLLVCRNRDGSIAWKRPFKNAPTAGGLDYLAQAGFTGGSAFSTWHVGLINLTSFSALAFNDTMSSHAGWIEFTGYSGTRPTWSKTEAGQLVASNGPFTYPITSNGTVHGIFVTSDGTVGGTSGTLWAHAVLATDAVVSIGQSVTGTYSIAFSGA